MDKIDRIPLRVFHDEWLNYHQNSCRGIKRPKKPTRDEILSLKLETIRYIDDYLLEYARTRKLPDSDLSELERYILLSRIEEGFRFLRAIELDNLNDLQMNWESWIKFLTVTMWNYSIVDRWHRELCSGLDQE